MTKVVKYPNHKVVLQKASIDSFQIYIPLSIIGRENVHESVLFNTIEYIEETSEIIKEKRNKLKVDCVGYSIYAYVRNKNTNGLVQEELVILLNAKFLESPKYFEGITKDNFPIIFNQLIEKKVLSDKVNYAEFIKHSSVTDLDVKQDFKVPSEEWDIIRKATKEFKRLDGVASIPMYNGGKGNVGFQFNNRERSTMYKPFLKGYSKEVELNTKSKDFKDAYLSDVDLTDLRRIEVQVKDKKHFQSFGVKDNSLETILNLSHKELHEIQCKIFDKYKPISFKEEKVKRKASEKLDYKSQFIYEVILQKMASDSMSFTTASIWAMNVYNGDRKQRYALKKTLSKLSNHYEKKGFNILSNTYSFASKTKIFQYYKLI